MTEVIIEKIMVVKGGGDKPGGFCFRNLGPNKDQIVEPGEVFPKSWIDPNTYAVLKKDKHIVDIDSEGAISELVNLAKKDAGEDRVGDDVNPFAELCVFDKSDLKAMSRPELDEVVSEVYSQAGIEDVPDFANMASIISFLTGESI